MLVGKETGATPRINGMIIKFLLETFTIYKYKKKNCSGNKTKSGS